MRLPNTFYCAIFCWHIKCLEKIGMVYHGQKRRAFTLIELMIVVVIVGILAALAVARYMKVSKRAKMSEAKVVLKNIWTCCQTYYEEHGCWPPNRHDIERDGYPEIAFSRPSGTPRFKYEIKSHSWDDPHHAGGLEIKAKCKKEGDPGYDRQMKHVEIRCDGFGKIWVHKEDAPH